MPHRLPEAGPHQHLRRQTAGARVCDSSVTVADGSSFCPARPGSPVPDAEAASAIVELNSTSQDLIVTDDVLISGCRKPDRAGALYHSRAPCWL